MVPKPVQRARRLIKKYGYDSPAEIDLIELLYAENLALKYETTYAYQGKIVFNKHAGIITLSTNLENEYQKRYVIAHEMGHFFNEKFKIRNYNPDIENRDAENAIMNDKLTGKDKLEKQRAGHGRVQSAEIVHEFKRDRYHDFIDTNVKRFEELKREREANQFAVELLMARSWFREVVRNKKPEIRTLREIAEKFRVSLTAAALRYAELYKGAMAVILSNNKRIEWMTCNKNFTFGKLNKYEPVPLNTRTHDIYDYLMPTNYIKNQRIRKCGYKQFMKEKTDYLDSLDETVTVNAADWFGDSDGYLNEIDFAMRKYGSVLTVMWEGD